MIGIYQITNKINGKKYIGQSRDIARRLREHKSKESNPRLKKDFEKFGINAFSFDVLEECELNELDIKERWYISQIKPKYNIASGGKGAAGHKLAAKVREKLRKAAILQWENKSSEEKAYVIKHQLTGKKFEKGHTVSAAVRKKLRDLNVGKNLSSETKAKISQKNRKAMIGNKNGNKSILCVETNEVFESIKKAALTVGVAPSGITHALKGDQKSAGGYHWKLV